MFYSLISDLLLIGLEQNKEYLKIICKDNIPGFLKVFSSFFVTFNLASNFLTLLLKSLTSDLSVEECILLELNFGKRCENNAAVVKSNRVDCVERMSVKGDEIDCVEKMSGCLVTNEGSRWLGLIALGLKGHILVALKALQIVKNV
ncbi:45_t:CDS:2 [Cetraspora pellucida]|uniref:45_t:CDS:1 n=1 Tax=Cetraspora pellucida TaxID=1433469 RepID=A0A9N9ES91_9GLOM|nr:45_t:CDS:2 [Cetraspora pellucida]